MAKPSTQMVAFPFSNDYRFDTEQGTTCKEVYIRSNQMEEKQENIPSSNTHKRKSLSALGMTLSVLFGVGKPHYYYPPHFPFPPSSIACGKAR